MWDQPVEIVRVAGQPVDTDQRRLSFAAEVEVVQLESAGGLKLIFGHLAKAPRGAAALRGWQSVLGIQISRQKSSSEK
jgi:hypothetical protein